MNWQETVLQAKGTPNYFGSIFLKDNLWPLFDGSYHAVPKWAFDENSKLR